MQKIGTSNKHGIAEQLKAINVIWTNTLLLIGYLHRCSRSLVGEHYSKFTTQWMVLNSAKLQQKLRQSLKVEADLKIGHGPLL